MNREIDSAVDMLTSVFHATVALPWRCLGITGWAMLPRYLEVGNFVLTVAPRLSALANIRRYAPRRDNLPSQFGEIVDK